MYAKVRAHFAIADLLSNGLLTVEGTDGPEDALTLARNMNNPPIRQNLHGVVFDFDNTRNQAWLDVPVVNGVIHFPKAPVNINKLATAYSIRDIIPGTPCRALGHYQHGAAKAVLDAHQGCRAQLALIIYSPTLAELDQLYEGIRRGTDLPINSWDEEQPRRPQ